VWTQKKEINEAKVRSSAQLHSTTRDNGIYISISIPETSQIGARLRRALIIISVSVFVVNRNIEIYRMVSIALTQSESSLELYEPKIESRDSVLLAR